MRASALLVLLLAGFVTRPGTAQAPDSLLTVIQRSSGDMRLNPHIHVAALDGLC